MGVRAVKWMVLGVDSEVEDLRFVGVEVAVVGVAVEVAIVNGCKKMGYTEERGGRL